MNKQILFSIALIGYITNSALGVEQKPTLRELIERQHEMPIHHAFKLTVDAIEMQGEPARAIISRSNFVLPSSHEQLDGKTLVICQSERGNAAVLNDSNGVVRDEKTCKSVYRHARQIASYKTQEDFNRLQQQQ